MRCFAMELLKILIFYLLMTVHLDSSARLKRFLGSCSCRDHRGAGFPKNDSLQWHSPNPRFQVTLDSPSEGGEEGPNTRRLGAAPGNFADPNDVCEIVDSAMIFSLYGLLNQLATVRRGFPGWPRSPSLATPCPAICSRVNSFAANCRAHDVVLEPIWHEEGRDPRRSWACP